MSINLEYIHAIDARSFRELHLIDMVLFTEKRRQGFEAMFESCDFALGGADRDIVSRCECFE